MKTRFTSIDIKVAVAEIMQSEAVGLRVSNVYDIDNKTYLIRLVHGDTKKVILLESGSRIHLTDYDWPKHMMPSGFSMKCRKHLKGRRLASVKQLGVDRIVDFTFGYEEAAYHLIVELYDRGNIILTDYEYQILQLLRLRTDADKDVKYAVRETYHIERARQAEGLISREILKEALQKSKTGETLKRALNPMFVYGPALLESSLLLSGLTPNMKLLHQFDPTAEQDMDKLMCALENAEKTINTADSGDSKGYIIQKKETRPVREGDSVIGNEELLTYNDFHPILYQQQLQNPHTEFPSFNKAVDEFFSKLESQKIDMKALNVEKAAIKRLENVKKDHEKRVDSLKHSQDEDMVKAELIEMNLPKVEMAIASINGAIANKIDWEEIQEIVDDAKLQDDPIAGMIKSLNLGDNQIIVSLSDPYLEDLESSDEESDKSKTWDKRKKESGRNINVTIDLSLTAFANARNYHNKRRHAAQKQQKTLHASKKALKSAEQKTQEMLKEMQTCKMINKTRKTNWFEKFYWFISSENYLVIGGRDQQQNELIVKRYLKAGDLYVHADLHGASSVILKNPGGGVVPPKTLNEAGTMAICYSAAWDARVVTSAWWVYHNQVSKTAPSGEYLTTGSFMIRGKKNYLPPSYLVMGFSIMFKLDESSVGNHLNDRKVKAMDDHITNEVTPPDEEVFLSDIDEDEKSIENENKNENGGEPNESTNDQDEMAFECEQMRDGINEMTLNERVSPIPTPENDDENNDEFGVDEEHNAFPDTNIELKHVSGDSFQLYRGIPASNAPGEDNDDFVYLGDDQKVSMKKQLPENQKPKLSAKQRRDLKKKKKSPQGVDIDNDHQSVAPQEKKDSAESKKEKTEKPLEQVQLKRRQKSKQKRMKDKYKDQDDEDRELMQQILRSHEPEKPPKKKGKQKQKQHCEKQSEKTKLQQMKIKPVDQPDILHQPDGELVAEEIKSEAVDEDLDEDEDKDVEKENISLLDSLTGCPIEDDILLYAIPCCAPYSSSQNFKFKAKLTPGSGRRGKAAKTALHMFQANKEASDWEKDLLKSLKDADISRNIPGKVKVSAPNLQKVKKK